MKSRRSFNKFCSGRNILFARGLAAIGTTILFGFACASQVRAQSTQTTSAPLPSFEVVSIKPDHSGPGMVRMAGPDPSRFVSVNSTVKMLIDFAFNVRDFQVSGGPGWIGIERFDIDAKVEDAMSEQLQKLARAEQIEQMRLMVRSMLADRFKLKVTHDTKEVPAFALTIAKGGSRLTESIAQPADLQSNSAPSPLPPSRGGGSPMPPPGAVIMGMGPGGKATLTGESAPLASLVNMLSQQFNRPILDQTGLKSTYDFSLEWTSDTGLGGGPLPVAPGPADAPAPDTSGTSLFTAIQDQLGLRLESTKGPVDTVIIEHIEEPTAN